MITARRVCTVLLTAFVVSLATMAHASAFVDLQVEPAHAQVGEIIRVRYSVRVRNEVQAQVAPLDFGGLELLSDPSPPELPMMWGGGFGLSIDTATEYLVRASAPGRYTITGARVIHAATGRVLAQHPGVTVFVGGSSGSVSVDASDSDASLVVQMPADPDMPPTGDLTGAEYNPTAFVRVAVDTPNPYLGQQVILRAWLYVSSSEVNCEVTHEPTLTGFWNEPLLPPLRECASRWFTQNVGGRYMSAGLLRKIALFPSQTGRLTIGKLTADVELLTGGLFRAIHHVEAHSPELVLEVREPPIEGRPAGYVPGVIGPVRLSAEADRTDVTVGETVTMTVRASSEGSLASARIDLPAPMDGIRVRTGGTRATHDTNSGRVTTTLVTEILAVPERAGRFELGDVELPYWDPVAGRYGIARVTLPSLRAHGASLPAEPQVTVSDSSQLLRPLTSRPSLRGYTRWFSRGPVPVMVVLAGPVVFLLGSVATVLARRAVRSFRARVEARRADPLAMLREAKRTVERDPALALSLAARALDRSVARVRERTDGEWTGLDPDVRSLIDDARQICDSARFAGAQVDAREVVTRVERAVRAIENAL